MAPAQKRLTRILLALAIVGSLLIGGLWWDSVRYRTALEGANAAIATANSSIRFFKIHNPSHFDLPTVFRRDLTPPNSYLAYSFFPIPALSKHILIIPFYLILLTHLSTLTLLWILLINRLARRESNKESRASSRLH